MWSEIPRFRLDPAQPGGAGQGAGEVGQQISPSSGEGIDAGNQPGYHLREVEITLDELAEMLGEELQLPRIKPKGEREIQSDRVRYTSIHTSGPESLRHFKRTFRQALKRQLALGEYDSEDPIITPISVDKRYKIWHPVKTPQNNAVIIYMMDVSGSMGEQQKEIVRTESFWIDTWLCHNYDGIQHRFIIHDARAREVDEETFFSTRESGGTVISSAYSLCNKIIDEDYAVTDWNIYPMHFSDGDNWSGGDTEKCVKLLEQELLPRVNVFCYGQVTSQYGSGKFLVDLQKHFKSSETLLLSKIDSKDGIYDSIKDFLGTGH